MLTTLAVHNYRSLRAVVVPLGALTVVTGANGSGKSNLYRALRLLADTAIGGAAASLAREGGFDSVQWAGPEIISAAMKRGDVPVQGLLRSEPVSLRLGFGSDEFGYSIEFGVAADAGKVKSLFGTDPIVARESVWHGARFRPAAEVVARRGSRVSLRDESGAWRDLTFELPPSECLFASPIVDPREAPEVFALRESMRSWRFYDQFRADADAPARQPQIGTRTPVLAADGRDLAAALQTIREDGAAGTLDAAIADAFPGARLEIARKDGRFTIVFHQHGLLRPLSTAELSDGTLRYLLWIAALLTTRPPEWMVLNEPETSLHPDLLPALARLVAAASKSSQVWVVTHARAFADELCALPNVSAVELAKEMGETHVKGQGFLARPDWEWPKR